jgi:hypothetical protein
MAGAFFIHSKGSILPVTILYQGSPLTFPNLDSPDEAYKALGTTAPAPTNPFGQSEDAAPTVDTSQFDATREPEGIDPELLKGNKSWLSASKVLYNATQGKDWEGDDAKLAEWGLDRMARFNNNLPLMGVDALSIKNAPTEQKKAFLYLLDTYDKTQWTMSGIGRSAKWMAMDPTSYVGLSTFGLGAVGAEGAKITTAAGVRAALSHALTGAIEGGFIGAAHSRIEQEARVNAEGQEGVNWGSVALNTAAGAGMGAVLSPLINGIAGHFKAKPKGVEPEGAPTPIQQSPESQLTLPLGDMVDPAQAAQTRLDRVAGGIPEEATQQTLPGFANNDVSVPKAFNELPVDPAPVGLPERYRPDAIGEPIDDAADRLMKDWGISHQNEMFPNHPPDRRLEPTAKDEPIRLESSTAQGNLFDNLPDSTRQTIDTAVAKASETGPSLNGQTKATALDAIPKPRPEEKIGGSAGPTLADLKKLMLDIGSADDKLAVRGWQGITNLASPLTRALVHMAPDDAKQLINEFAASSMSQKEFKAFTAAAINAQNSVASYIDSMIRDRKFATGAAKEMIERKIAAAEQVFSPLKLMAKEAGSTSGETLASHNYNRFSGDVQRSIDIDHVLRDMGLDPALATNAQKADAFEKWFGGVVDNYEKSKSDKRVLDLRRTIAESPPTADTYKLWDQLAQLREDIRKQEIEAMGGFGKFAANANKVTGAIANFMVHTVLTPSSLVVNTVSNALMTFSRPALGFLAKSDAAQFRHMTASYGAMFRVSGAALNQARLAFDLEHSLMSGTESKWIENQLKDVQTKTGNPAARFLGRNAIRIWTRALNATDEFFQVVAYHGFIEGDAAAKAMLAAKEQGLDKAATKAMVKDAVQRKLDNAFGDPDSSTIGMLRDAGMKKGYSGENLKLWIQNQLDTNKSALRKATDEEGLSYTNDLLFKKEFSGDNALSGAAAGMERFIQNYPVMRIMGQLFFRTPIRVFEAGMRMLPGVQLIHPHFFDDLNGRNGLTKQIRARGELMLGYGFTTSVMTGFATGNITGSGADLTPMERRKLEDSGWRPYSIKMGDGTWFNYRNYDPVSTPIKVIVNAMERLQHLQFKTAQGEMESKSSLEQIMGYVGIGTASVINAVKDANLASGIDDWVKLGQALGDPDRKENAFKQLFQSKAQLAVPNSIRRSVKFFGEGQNVSNEPSSTDQILESIVNPASDKVTHQFDSLGFPRSTQQQGFFPFIGIDAADREARTRGLSDRDSKTLNEIAKMTYATGKTFNPSHKWGDLDLKSEATTDGRTTLYNKAMQLYNKQMPEAASEFFDAAKDVPMGRRGSGLSPKGEAFSKLQTSVWRASLMELAEKEPKIMQALQNQAGIKADVSSGNREVASPF